MANITLSSLKFPGLSDTYTIPAGAVFVAYQFGTNAEIETAWSSQTPVFCLVPQGQNPGVLCRLFKRSSATLHYFSGEDEYGKTIIGVCDNGAWSNYSVTPAAPSSATPQPLGTADSGSSADYSRADHVHAKPTYSASDVGAIAAPSSPATGAFLVWNGSAWVAQTLSTWSGGSY